MRGFYKCAPRGPAVKASGPLLLFCCTYHAVSLSFAFFPAGLRALVSEARLELSVCPCAQQGSWHIVGAQEIFASSSCPSSVRGRFASLLSGLELHGEVGQPRQDADLLEVEQLVKTSISRRSCGDTCCEEKQSRGRGQRPIRVVPLCRWDRTCLPGEVAFRQRPREGQAELVENSLVYPRQAWRVQQQHGGPWRRRRGQRVGGWGHGQD